MTSAAPPQVEEPTDSFIGCRCICLIGSLSVIEMRVPFVSHSGDRYTGVRSVRPVGYSLIASRAISSAGERFVHTEEATGSIPVSPTDVSAGQGPLPVGSVTGAAHGAPYGGSRLGAQDRPCPAAARSGGSRLTSGVRDRR